MTAARQTGADPAPRTGLRLGLILAAAVLVLDQITKIVILEWVMDPPRLITVTPFFDLVLVWNRGVSFSMLASDHPAAPWLLSALSIAISAALIVWMRRTTDRWILVALGLIVGGALGNVIDRIRFGAVADFLSLHAYGWYWPAFNVADSGITVGAVALLVLSIRGGEQAAGSGVRAADTDHDPAPQETGR